MIVVAETGAGEPASTEVQSLVWIERHAARRLDLLASSPAAIAVTLPLE